MSQVLPRARLSDHLVDHFAERIVAGRLRPGEPLLPEPELAAQFNISKVVVRESIQTLASLGMLQVQHGKRTVVLDEGEWNLLAPPVQRAYRLAGRVAELTRQLYEVRIVLEASAAGWAADRANARQREDLLALVDRMGEIARVARDPRAFLLADRDFHDIVAAAAENIVLRGTIRNLHNFLTESWLRSHVSPGQLESLTDQHRAVATAIASRDAPVARRAMTAHLEWAQARDTRDALARAEDDDGVAGEEGIANTTTGGNA